VRARDERGRHGRGRRAVASERESPIRGRPRVRAEGLGLLVGEL
jgi:hypothetical protein